MTATLAEVKVALRIESADTSHDDRINLFLDAANFAVAEASGVDDWTDHPNLTTAAVFLTCVYFEKDDLSGISDGLPGPVESLVNLSRTGWVKS